MILLVISRVACIHSEYMWDNKLKQTNNEDPFFVANANLFKNNAPINSDYKTNVIYNTW